MAFQFGRSRLPELLTKNRMTKGEFAAMLGVTQGYISQIISGESKFSLIRAKNAANILKCNIEDLYFWEWKGK